MIVQGRAGSPQNHQELANILVTSANNHTEHLPGTLTTMAGQLDLTPSLLSSLHNQQLDMMDSSQQQITASKIEEMLGVSLKDVNALDTNFTLDPVLSELALKVRNRLLLFLFFSPK